MYIHICCILDIQEYVSTLSYIMFYLYMYHWDMMIVEQSQSNPKFISLHLFRIFSCNFTALRWKIGLSVDSTAGGQQL